MDYTLSVFKNEANIKGIVINGRNQKRRTGEESRNLEARLHKGTLD